MAKATVENLSLNGSNLTTRIEAFKGDALGVDADHFAVVRLLSANNKRQRDWGPFFDQLNKAVSASVST